MEKRFPWRILFFICLKSLDTFVSYLIKASTVFSIRKPISKLSNLKDFRFSIIEMLQMKNNGYRKDYGTKAIKNLKVMESILYLNIQQNKIPQILNGI